MNINYASRPMWTESGIIWHNSRDPVAGQWIDPHWPCTSQALPPGVLFEVSPALSIAALTWAFSLSIKPASLKFLLVSLSDYANEDGRCYPSIVALTKKTCLDRKTIIAGLDELESLGLVRYTGSNVGRTGQVKVYQLNGFQEPLSKSPENGTVPKTEANSTVFPMKESRFSHQRVPKTEHGTLIEPLEEPSLTEAFEKFWKVYPKKTEKVGSLGEYRNLLKAGIAPEAIQKGAQDYAELKKTEGTEERYITSPRLWLMNRRWEDELHTAPKSSPWNPPDDPHVKALLAVGVRDSTFTTILKDAVFSREGEVVVIQAPTKQAADSIRNNLESKLRAAFGHYPEVRVA